MLRPGGGWHIERNQIALLKLETPIRFRFRGSDGVSIFDLAFESEQRAYFIA